MLYVPVMSHVALCIALHSDTGTVLRVVVVSSVQTVAVTR